VIKIPKFEKTDKKFNETVNPSDFDRMEDLHSIRKIYDKKKTRRSMKSLSPIKRYHNSKFNASMDCITDFSSKAVKTEFKREIKRRKLRHSQTRLLHMHMAGPGSYNLPPLMGQFTFDANKHNNPCYSIGKEDRDTVRVLDKNQADAQKGQHSPGVGRYSPDNERLRNHSPYAKIGREKRFMTLKACDDLKKRVPHAYIDSMKSLIGDDDNKSIGFTKEKRFLVQHFKLRGKEFMPAPNQYNSHLHNTISSTQSSQFFARSNSFGPNERDRFGKDADKFNNKQYFKELDRGYLMSISPGPAAYQNNTENLKSLSHVRKSFDNSFTKVFDPI